MLIKLLCIETTDVCNSYDEELFTINEGDIINALIDEDGIRFEYEENTYSPSYYYEDVEKLFISAFDVDSYNKIYQKAKSCTMYLQDGLAVALGDGIVKMEV